MTDGTFMSWQEMQLLCLPPNSAMLVPPPPDAAELEAMSAGAPGQRPEWLDDAFQMAPTAEPSSREPEKPVQPIDLAANEAAAQRAEYGEPAVRLLANAIAMGALLEMTQLQPKPEQPKNRQDPHPSDPVD